MLELIKKYRRRLLFGLVMFAALIFYSLNLKDKEHANFIERGALRFMAPLQVGVTEMDRAMEHIWADYVDLLNVRKENKRLMESLKALNARLQEDREALLANERLKKLLDLKDTLRAPLVAAVVIGEDSSPWFKTILIDRGERDGLREGMPVVASEGVVGQLVKVAPETSRVILLTDHASAIAGVIQRSRARGVARGKGNDRCALEFTLREEEVKVGDLLVTSGMGGVFPKGLPIGEVTMVKKGEYGIFQAIEVRPAVNINRLEEVLVLIQQKPGL
ncbi:MAG: rod shape-determining protein MreC [Geobacteraceae bacterium]